MLFLISDCSRKGIHAIWHDFCVRALKYSQQCATFQHQSLVLWHTRALHLIQASLLPDIRHLACVKLVLFGNWDIRDRATYMAFALDGSDTNA